MGQVTIDKTIPHSSDRVWGAIAHIQNIYRFNPAVKVSPLLTAEDSGVGAKRRCEFHDGNHVIEEVVGWDEGRSMDIDIVEGSMPLSRARARLSIEPVDAKNTTVRFTMDYTPKYGPMGALMDVLMMRRMFRKMMQRILEGLGTHLETGAVVGEDGQPEAVGTSAVA